jgi:hypothetical protein
MEIFRGGQEHNEDDHTRLELRRVIRAMVIEDSSGRHVFRGDISSDRSGSIVTGLDLTNNYEYLDVKEPLSESLTFKGDIQN